MMTRCPCCNHLFNAYDHEVDEEEAAVEERGVQTVDGIAPSPSWASARASLYWRTITEKIGGTVWHLATSALLAEWEGPESYGAQNAVAEFDAGTSALLALGLLAPVGTSPKGFPILAFQEATHA